MKKPMYFKMDGRIFWAIKYRRSYVPTAKVSPTELYRTKKQAKLYMKGMEGCKIVKVLLTEVAE